MPELDTAGREAVRAALTATRSEDLIGGVKTAVAREFEALDPTVRIKTTDYFNHTFAPDLELSWPDERKHNRFVYLRYTLRAAVAGQDFHSLGPLSPVVLALRDEGPDEIEQARRNMAETEAASGLLATDVGALDDLGNEHREPNSRPLLELVRGNVVRGARGLLVSDGMQRLTTQAASTDLDDPVDQATQLAVFQELVGEVFLPEAATRLTRAAQLVGAGVTGDLAPLLGDEEENEGREPRGRLSPSELRVLLPYFLRADAPPRSTAFWQYLGSLTSLSGLEAMWDVLLDSDLTAFVRPNLDVLRAKRAQLVLKVDPFEEPHQTERLAPPDAGESTDSPAEQRQPQWQIRHRRLCLNTDHWRVLFTTDQRALQGRPDSAPARWDDLAAALSRFDLVRVSLHGAARRLEVTAERAADVYRDVTTIRERIHDDFHVPAVTVRARRPESANIDTNFSTMLAEPDRGTASVRDLAEVGLTILGHRNPVSDSDLNALS